MKKNIQEQSAETNTSPEVFLKQALTNCFQIRNDDGISQKYTWFKIDNNYTQLGTPGLVKLKDGRFAIKGFKIKGFKIKDTKTGKQLPTPQDIYWFADKTVLNATTGNQITWTPCPEITKTAGVTQDTTKLTPDQQAMGSTITADDQGWTNTKFSDYDTYPEKYETKKIGDVIYYKPIAFKNLKPDQITNIKLKFQKDGLTFTEPAFGTPEWEEWSQNKKTLKDLISVEDAEVLGLKDLRTNVYPIKAGGQTLSADSQYCTTQLADYFTKAIQSTATNEKVMTDQQIKTYKENIKKCKGLGMYDNFKFDERTLDPQVTKSLKPYGFLNKRLTYKEIAKNLSDMNKEIAKNLSDMKSKSTLKKVDFGLPESKSNQIKNLIRENLIKTSENRKRILNEERSIVRKRIILLAEKVNIKSKSSRENFCDELLGEMIYLNKQGFDKEVISEQVLDAIKSIFGNSGEGILQAFKQRMAEKLVGKLLPGAEKSWLGGILINVFTDTGILEIPKLTQCSFLTKKIAEAIVEEVPKQIQQSTGKTGFLWDILRNSMLETLEESSFGQHLERGLVDVVCPMIDKVKNRLFGIEDKMKKGLTSKEKETDSSGSVEPG